MTDATRHVVALAPGLWLGTSGDPTPILADAQRFTPSRADRCRAVMLPSWPNARAMVRAATPPDEPDTTERQPFFVVELAHSPPQWWLGRDRPSVSTPVEWETFETRLQAEEAMRGDDGVGVFGAWPDARVVEHDAEPEAEPDGTDYGFALDGPLLPDESEATEQPEPVKLTPTPPPDMMLRVVADHQLDLLHAEISKLKSRAKGYKKNNRRLRKIVAQQARQVAKLCKVRR